MKNLFKLTVAALVVMGGIFASCQKLNDLEKRVDAIENSSIASVNQQIESVKATVATLTQAKSEIDSKISDLKVSDATQGVTIAALQKAGETLGQKVDELKNFIDADPITLAKNWASATFATLKQLESTSEVLATVKTTVESLGLKVDALDKSIETLKGWINEKFAGYYTIAEVDAKLNALEEKVFGPVSADSSIIVKEAADYSSIAEEIAKVKEEIAEVKEEVTAAYGTAIEEAFAEYDGKVTAAVEAALAPANESIVTLTTSLDEVTARVAELEAKVEGIIGMIQSVVFMPEYMFGLAVVESQETYNFFTRQVDTVFKDLALDFELSGCDTSSLTVAQVVANAFAFDNNVVTVDYKSVKFPPIIYTGWNWFSKANNPFASLRIKSVTPKMFYKNVITVTIDGSSLNNPIVKRYVGLVDEIEDLVIKLTKDNAFPPYCEDIQDKICYVLNQVYQSVDLLSLRIRIQKGNTDILSDYVNVIPSIVIPDYIWDLLLDL